MTDLQEIKALIARSRSKADRAAQLTAKRTSNIIRVGHIPLGFGRDLGSKA